MLTMMYIDYSDKQVFAHDSVVGVYIEVYIYPYLPLVRRIIQNLLYSVRIFCITPP